MISDEKFTTLTFDITKDKIIKINSRFGKTIFMKIDKFERVDSCGAIDFYGEEFTVNDSYKNSVRYRKTGYCRMNFSHCKELNKDFIDNGKIWAKLEVIKHIITNLGA